MRIAAAAIGVVIFSGACSSPPDVSAARGTEASSSSTGAHHSATGNTEYEFGQPGDVTSIDRLIKVVQLDSFRFDPNDISISAGDTIRFRISNEGTLPHEFVLGDKEFQEEHERLMGEVEGEMRADTPSSINVEPGAQQSLTWTFTDPGTVLFACHVLGHYAAGMVGTVHVGS
jgi:uncharacterized cupredoxin-like copper-binding protein